MAIDPLANIVDRLRSSGFQPRKVGHDAWECASCARRHRRFLSRGRDGKLVLQCRSTPNCSFSAILKKLNIKLRHLNRDTKESVIRRLRTMEVKLGLYQRNVPLVADPVVLSLPVAATLPNASALAEDEDITTAARAVTAAPVPDFHVPTRTESEAEVDEQLGAARETR